MSVCARCGKGVEVVQHTNPTDSPLCRECAEREPFVHVFVFDSGKAHEDLRLKKKRPEEKRAYEELRSGESFEHRTGVWRDRVQRVDRDNNQYDKVVTDQETGKPFHECHEPLSRHRDHGSAKKSKDLTTK